MFLKSTKRFVNFQRYIDNPFLYKLLNLEPNASRTQIKTNYYLECLKYHPDHNAGSAIRFMEINKAFQILNNVSKKQLYDGLDYAQFQDFSGLWKINFHENKTKIEKLKRYQKDNNLEKSYSILGYFISKMINHYNKIIVYDQSQVDERATLYQSKHVYFILDVSYSMSCFDKVDSCYTSVPKTYTSMQYRDGEKINCYDIDHKYHHIVNQATYVIKSINQIKSICEQLSSTKQGYLTSFMTFSKHYNKLWSHQPVDSILDKIKYICSNPDQLSDNEFTHIYDTLKFAINDVKQNGNISLTDFILVTDGVDFKSDTRIEEILAMVKNINIIILTINVKNPYDLKRICDGAKSGKLLEIGSEYNFGQDFNQAFTTTKDLILHNQTRAYLDIKREFNL